MKTSKILFLYNLINILTFQLGFFLLISILFKNHYLLLIIPITFIPLIFEFKKREFEIFYKVFAIIISLFLLIYLNIPITFNLFIKIFIFSIIYIFSILIIKKESANILSQIFLIINLILYEKIFGLYFSTFLISFILIILSLYFKLQKNKSFYFWENKFSILSINNKKVFKNLILIFLISILIITSTLFINVNFFRKISLTPIINNLQNNGIEEKSNLGSKNEINISIKRYIFKISDFSIKFLNFILNSFYLIVFIGMLIVFFLFSFKLFNLIKFVYGRKKSIKFLISSFFISISIILSIYFLYKPFEMLIRSIVKNLNIKKFDEIPIFEFINRIRRFFSGYNITNEKQIPISIDIGLILVIFLFVLMVTLFLYYMIFYIYKSTFNERQIELNKILDEFRDEKREIFEISGNPKEKIIALYNILIRKLNFIISKLKHETPNEYRIKFKKEKPELSNEIDIITDSFIISKYSNYNISEDLFNKTFSAYKKLSDKILKEVYFGREV
jgi:hypothetical protein